MIKNFFRKDNVLLFDGAMGTMLQKKGFKITENLGKLNITNPNIIKDIHKEYIEAGAKIITTNTFGANEKRLKNTEYDVEEIIKSGIQLAIEAKQNKDILIAFDVGPIGEFLEPIGRISFDEAYNIFKRQIICASNLDIDLILIETMMDINEAKAAVIAAKENCEFPIFCTMTFDTNGRTFTGCSASDIAKTLDDLDVDAIGINCSLGPKGLLNILKEMKRFTTKPLIVQPNAGLPEVHLGNLIYNIPPNEFKEDIFELIKGGATIVGGCCGTTPEYIREIYNKINSKI